MFLLLIARMHLYRHAGGGGVHCGYHDYLGHLGAHHGEGAHLASEDLA